MNTAVAFLIFSRPEPTRRVLAAIREARPRLLLVVADGPRADRPEDAAKCAEVREVVERGVDWPCEVRKNYADTNLGCARRVSSGLDWVFEEVEEAIILEDDCLPHATFFPFCEELLARYREDERVAQIAGCSFQDQGRAPASPSYFFSRYPHCWGWATWRRAWRHYDHSMSAWRQVDRSWLDEVFEEAAERRWWSEAFDATAAGRLDSWAFRWTLSTLSRGRVSAVPFENLVTNIGFGADATHTRGGDRLEIPATGLSFPLSHPAGVRRHEGADAHTSRRLFRKPGVAARVLRIFRRLFAT